MTRLKSIEDISEIRNMMERASRFISLSGLSGVFSGFFAVIGSSAAYWYFNIFAVESTTPFIFSSLGLAEEMLLIGIILPALVFIFALGSALYLTTKNSKRKSLPIWDTLTKKLVLNLFGPIFIGGIFILALISKNYFDLLIPASLIFYGLALINGSHFTYSDIRHLGYVQIILGIVSLWLSNYAIIIWGIGFGVMHVIYGMIMYFKYER